MSTKLEKILFVIIFLLASFFRLYGMNWDQNQHLHPDERFLTMVTTDIKWPKSLSEYLDSSTSSLNPHNKGYNFFVYGTFPIFFTKAMADLLGGDDYMNLTPIGRQLSAFADIGTTVLIYLIALQINSKFEARNTKKSRNANISNTKLTGLDHWKIRIWNLFRISVLEFRIFPLLAMFLYASMVLPIQLAHFYAVDTYLTFFITLAFFFFAKMNIFAIQNSKSEARNTRLTLNSNIDKFGEFKIRIWNLFRVPNFEFRIYSILLGIAFGLALSSKITAALFGLVLALGMLVMFFKAKNKFLILASCFFMLISTYITFRFAQPYLFANPDITDVSLNQKVLDNWKQLKSFDDASGNFPPAVQWITTKPYIFPLKNYLFWGVGLPIGIISLAAAVYLTAIILLKLPKSFRLLKSPEKIPLIHDSDLMILSLSLLGTFLLFLYQGGQFVKALRYFYPVYPFLALISGYFVTIFIYWLEKKISRPTLILLFSFCILLLILIYPVAFISIYSRPHSRVVASEWIYQNIPAGASLSSEHWDDGLPLSLPSPGFISEKYKHVEFPLYWPDNQEKWTKMSQALNQVDYILLTSNRLYGSTMTFPPKYPVTIKYYSMLFDGSLGFEKVAEFTSRPNLPIPGMEVCLTPPFVRYGIIALKSQECSLPGISLVDDYADETFTVYDHPKVIIFKKVRTVDYYRLLFGQG